MKIIGYLIVILGISSMSHASIPVLDCLIEPEVMTTVASPVEGVVAKVLVQKGDVVKKGQAIAYLESSVEAATVALAKAKADVAEEIAWKKANLEFVALKYQRIKKLHEKNVVSDVEFDEVATDWELAKIELQQAIDKQNFAQLELNRSQHALERRTITSPIDGVVVERIIEPGESTGDKKIVRVAKIHPLKVSVIVPSEYFGQIKGDVVASIKTEFPSDATYKANVARVDKVIDPSSGHFDVHLSLPNPDFKVPSGMKCQVSFSGDGFTNMGMNQRIDFNPVDETGIDNAELFSNEHNSVFDEDFEF